MGRRLKLASTSLCFTDTPLRGVDARLDLGGSPLRIVDASRRLLPTPLVAAADPLAFDEERLHATQHRLTSMGGQEMRDDEKSYAT